MKKEISGAVQVLNAGGMVIYPTETVYGIGVDAYSKKAINKLYVIKKRVVTKSISIAVSSIGMIEKVAYVNEFSKNFINFFLPGPITIIMPAKKVLTESLIAEDGTIGIRMPDNHIALSLISKFGRPITSTSANISGEPAPKQPEDIKIGCDFILDGGVLPGVPSTVVDLNKRIILREGSMCREVNEYLKSI